MSAPETREGQDTEVVRDGKVVRCACLQFWFAHHPECPTGLTATPPAPEVTEADEAWVYALLDREFGTERKEAYLRELAEHIFFHFAALRATRREP